MSEWKSCGLADRIPPHGEVRPCHACGKSVDRATVLRCRLKSPAPEPCPHLGEIDRSEPCRSGSGRLIPISECGNDEIQNSGCVSDFSTWARLPDAVRDSVSNCQACPANPLSQQIASTDTPANEQHIVEPIQRVRVPLRKDVLRVGLASYGFYTGGVEEWFKNLVRGNQDAGIRYTAVGVMESHQIGTDRAGGIPIVPHGQLHEHCDIILGWSTSLLHLQSWPGKIVYVAHGSTSWTAECVNRHIEISDALVAVSEASRRVIRAPYCAVQLIRNGVDRERLITPDQRSVKSPTLGYLGRWSIEKRPHLVAEAAQKIGCRAAFLVPSEKQREAKEALKKYPIKIDWYTTEQLKEFLSSISCLVVPSAHEGGPIVVAEAWSSGVPVACTSVGMVPEMEAEHGPLTIRLSNPPTEFELSTIVDRIDDSVTQRAYNVAETQTKEQMSAAYATLFRRLIPCQE